MRIHSPRVRWTVIGTVVAAAVGALLWATVPSNDGGDQRAGDAALILSDSSEAITSAEAMNDDRRSPDPSPSATSADGPVAASRLAPAGIADIEWRDPGGWTVVDVTRSGLPPNRPDIDAAAAVQAIVASTKGRRVLYFPGGAYYFRSTLTIGVSDVRLRGAGQSQTTFAIDAPSHPDAELRFAGTVSASTTPVTGSPMPGDRSITVADAAGYRVGDIVQLYLDGGRRALSQPNEMQLLQITRIDGNRLDVDMRIGLPYPAAKRPMIRHVEAIRNVGIEDLQIERRRRPASGNVSNVSLFAVANALVYNIESDRAGRHHVMVQFSRDVVVERTFLHGYFVEQEGYGYGAGAAWSTRVRMSDNKMYDLRHSFVLQLGTNHSIVSYNTTELPRKADNDLALYGNYANNNLFEGNTFADGYADASREGSTTDTGPGNVWFRNRASGRIGSLNPTTTRQVIIGNVVDAIAAAGRDHFVSTNRVKGVVQRGAALPVESLPPSLYLTRKPSFLGSRPWPLFGPGTQDWGAGNTTAAGGRAKRGWSWTDDLSSWNDSYAHTSGLRIETGGRTDLLGGDDNRITRMAAAQNTDQAITYFRPSVHTIFMTVYHWPNEKITHPRLEASADGKQWRPVAMHFTAGTGNWIRYDYMACGLRGVDYLRVILPATTGKAWAQEIAKVTIFN